MKKIIYIFAVTLFFAGLSTSCKKSDNYNGLSGAEGGLYTVNTSAIIYNLGNMDSSYEINLKYYQGKGAKIKRIDVYQQFFTTDIDNNPIKSDVKLFKSLDLSAKTQPGYINTSASFRELDDATTLSGVAIPKDDTLLRSGFYWILTYKAVLDDGREVSVNQNTIFVNAKYAGTYKIVEKKYYRIGVLRDDLDAAWASTVYVSALDATTYIITGQLGPFVGATTGLVFSIEDNGDPVLPINYYKTYGDIGAVKINSQPLITCADNAGQLGNVDCANSNVVIKGSSDTLKMSFGYFTDGSGSREFYQKLVKI